jgi:hypothetical protein
MFAALKRMAAVELKNPELPALADAEIASTTRAKP